MNPKQTQYGVAMISLFGVRAPKGPSSMQPTFHFLYVLQAGLTASVTICSKAYF